MTRSFSPGGRASHDTHERYTTGGLLVYAAIVPALVAFLTAPTALAAFVVGAATALLVRSLRTRRTNTDPESRRRSSRDTA